MKRIPRQPEGRTKERIIEILGKEPYSRRFTDLKNELNISKPVLAEHLNTLKKEGKITYDKVGKEVYYMLTDKAWERLETRISLFSSTITSYINGELTAWTDDVKKLQKLSEKELLTELARKISASILFAQIKSAETNQEWHKAAEHFARDTDALIKRRIIYPEFDHKIWNKPLSQIDKLKPKIARLYSALRELYPDEVKVLEDVYKNPRELMVNGELKFRYSKPTVTEGITKAS